MIVQALQISFCIFLRLSPDWPQASFISIKKKTSPGVEHEITTQCSHSEHYLYWLLCLERFEFPTSSAMWYLASFRRDTFLQSEPTGHWAEGSGAPRLRLKGFAVSGRSLLQCLLGRQESKFQCYQVGECSITYLQMGLEAGLRCQ